MRGNRFCNVDLHVHTPASNCFAESDVTPQDIVAQATAAGMRAIAITDHNTAEWADRVKEAARDTELTVFPGVEITVQPGVHVLAIFSETCAGAQVTDMLAQLGLGVEQRGKSEALVPNFSVQKVVATIREHGALPILAHIDAPKGIWKVLRGSGQTLIQIWETAEFAAVEIVEDNLPPEVGCAPFEHRPAYYWASDNPHPDDDKKHSHRGIGRRYSRFKLAEQITWEGLRLCFADPDVRIRRGIPGEDCSLHYPVLEEVNIEGGFLTNFASELNPNLNCIIGGRGTGKSTLLELLRYTFDIRPKTEANQNQAHEIMTHTFPAGSRVTVSFTLADGTAYRVVRVAAQAPQVFRVGEDEPRDVRPSALLPLQIYGQKEIYEISKDPTFQLRLLDHYVDEAFKPYREREEDLLRQLRENAATILRLEDNIAAAQEWLSRLGAIEEELNRMEQQDFVTRIEQKRVYDQEKHLLDQVQGQIDRLLEALDSFLSGQELDIAVLAAEAIEGLPHREMLRTQRGLLQAIDTNVKQTLAALKEQINAKWAEGKAAREAWQTDYVKQNDAYQELLREFQASDQTVAPDRYIQLQRRKQELAERARAVQRQRTEVEQLLQARHELLAQLRQVRREQYEIRRDKAAELTALLDQEVRVTVHPAGYRDVYKDYLRELFAGLNVRNPQRDQLAEVEAAEPEQEEQRPVQYRGEMRYLTPRIPRYLDPIDLAAAIRTEQERADEAESLLEICFGVDSDAMRRNMAGVTRQQLFELETFAVPDLPIIELHVANGELGYKPLAELSIGQKCTALLSIVLLESSAPLLIDQPEDDLDNQFIFDRIVATLRREKERRQFLIATHNANIPVSGDAELIIVLQADEEHGWADDEGIGSIDTASIKHAVENILEGGRDAFRIRKEKYGIE